MLYRVTMDLPFDEQSDAQTLVDLALKLAKKAININEGKDNEERGFVDYRECNHDDLTRTIPDVIIARFDVGS